MKKLCRLCLIPCNNDYENVSEVIIEILDILLLKLDFDITITPALCKKCVKSLHKCFSFKSTCFYTEEFIFPYINTEDVDNKLDLKELYMSRQNLMDLKLPDNYEICRFCLDIVTDEKFIPLCEVDQYQISKCIPELKFVSTKSPVICSTCHTNLISYSDFMDKCKHIEEKINKYQQCKGQIKKNKIALNSVVQLLGKEAEPTISEKILSKLINTVPVTEYVTPETVEIQPKKENCLEDGRIIYKCARKKVTTYNYSQEEIEKKKHVCEDCPFRTSTKKALNRHRYLNHSEPVKFSCDKCSYETAIRNHLKRHHDVHFKKPKPVAVKKCPLCDFRARFACIVRNHMIKHVDASHSAVYRCEQCPYKSRYKATLISHMRKHETKYEYSCEQCSFRTKYVESYKRHLTRHKDASEIQFYQCAQCDYKSPRKPQLNIHIMRAHMDPSEVSMYRCEHCPFNTFYKADYKLHVLKHKDRSEVTVYMCETCDFEAVHKKQMRAHELTHVKDEKAFVYGCELCPYRAKKKYIMDKHMLKHKDRSELELFICYLCGTSFKDKNNMRSHIRKHQNGVLKRRRNTKVAKT